MKEDFTDKLKRRCLALGVDLDSDKLEMLYRYYEMLVEKNKVMNLTAITGEDEAITKHFTDSLSIVKAVNAASISAGRLIDVGTGAGFPGLVIKIAFPGLDVTLFDSLNKRLIFLDEVIARLRLTGVSTVHGRAEDFGKNPGYRERYDIVTARAVSNMAVLAEYCLPFAKVGGCFVAYKSADAAEETTAAGRAIKELGGAKPDIIKFTLPESDISRSLVVIGKTKKTPAKYPRRAGVPSENPIG